MKSVTEGFFHIWKTPEFHVRLSLKSSRCALDLERIRHHGRISCGKFLNRKGGKKGN